MKIRLFDTFSGKAKPLPVVSKKQPLRLFVCGPTVYDFLHIGNARTYIVFDAFVRYLRFLGVPVFYLQNITDIDDKIIARAGKEKTTPARIAQTYKKVYFSNMNKLGIISVDMYAPATKFIPQIITQIKILIEKGHVYKSADGYYFNLSTFPDYGLLAHRTATEAEDGVSRIDESVDKKNKGDFCVWKFSKPGEPTWKTSIGPGRPGWHIEDTAISEHFFGPQYDIHGGGIDLKFPHHEAEIAQQESASGKKPFVKIWMHIGSVMVDGKKMSKSLGNFIKIEDFLSDFSPMTLRLIALSSHYRSPVRYTKEMAQGYANSWNAISESVYKLNFVKNWSKSNDLRNKTERKIAINRLKSDFFHSLAEDFNTPQALAVIFEHFNTLQPIIWKISSKEAEEQIKIIEKLIGVLGFSVPPLIIPQKIKALVKARETARNNKQFIQSDELRKQINALGYNLDDTPYGQFVRPQK